MRFAAGILSVQVLGENGQKALEILNRFTVHKMFHLLYQRQLASRTVKPLEEAKEYVVPPEKIRRNLVSSFCQCN